MASKKISQLPLATQVDGDDIIPLVQAGVSKKTTAQDIADLAGSTYLVYTALLTQSGTDAPVAIVLHNTIGEIVWTRTGVGSYTGTLVGAFPENKTFAIMGSQYLNAWILERNDDNTVVIATYSGGASDDVLINTSIEIRVYP